MPLLTQEDAARLSPLFKGKAGALLYKAVMHIASLDDLTDVYDSQAMYEGPDFALGILNHTGAVYHVGGSEHLKTLPEGPFVTISNHPYGGIDGLVLVDLFGHLRPDYKVMVNKILGYLKALGPSFITVTPTGNEKAAPTRESLKGIRLSMEHVRDGHPLGIFPSGAVSDLSLKDRCIRDRAWQEPVIRMIRKMNVPVLPVRFFDRNSLYYYLLGLIDWRVRLLRLAREGINKRGKRIRVGIGPLIAAETIQSFSDTQALGTFLREQVYGMPLPDHFVTREEIL